MWLPPPENRGDRRSRGKGADSALGSAVIGCWQNPTAGVWGILLLLFSPLFSFPFFLLNSLDCLLSPFMLGPQPFAFANASRKKERGRERRRIHLFGKKTIVEQPMAASKEKGGGGGGWQRRNQGGGGRERHREKETVQLRDWKQFAKSTSSYLTSKVQQQ